MEKEVNSIRNKIIRLCIEGFGWIIAVIGAYFIIETDATFIHYGMLIFGVILIGVFFPYKDFRRKK